MTSRSGTSLPAVASRLVQYSTSSSPSSGGADGLRARRDEEVVVRKLLAPRRGRGPARRPRAFPRTKRAPRFSSHVDLARVVLPGDLVPPGEDRPRGRPGRPRPTASSSRAAITSVGRRSVFDGMHAQYEHSPPTSSRSHDGDLGVRSARARARPRSSRPRSPLRGRRPSLSSGSRASATASRARSISGSAATRVPIETTSAATTAVVSGQSRGGDPPAGTARARSSGGLMNIARMTPR